MSDFKVLTESQHILARPGMYIGSVNEEAVAGMFNGKYKTLQVVPGLLKIINEILDNCIDEYIRTDGKFANKISIDIKENPFDITREEKSYTFTISDNGRGIPINKLGKTDDTYQPVLGWTRARAGSNFNDAGRTTLGTNGVGSFCTNVFSSEFIGTTINNGKMLKLHCMNGANIKSIEVTDTARSSGTTVSFVPDLKHFSIVELNQDHYDFLRDRIENLAVCYPNIVFTFMGEKIVGKSVKDYAKRYGEVNIVATDKKNVIVIAPSGDDEEFRFVSYANGLWNKNGGSHVDMIMDNIVTPLREVIKKKHKIDVLPNQIRSHLVLVVISRDFENLKFDSQTKERVTNTRSECAAQYSGIDFDKIAKNILNTPEIIDPIIQAMLFKKEQAERLALARNQKKIQKVRVANHIEAQSKNPADKTLFITEGLSAIGQLISVRDPKTVGGYPLKGKVLNVRGMKPVEIIKNKEIAELMNVIGLEFGKPATNLNYSKIVILTDADVDGAGISCLLINLFSIWPELFKNGNVYRCDTPLYICTKGKDVKWFYTKSEFDKFNSSSYNVEYAKGLGSLAKEVYKEVINNPRLIKVSMNDSKDMQSLEMAFGDDSSLRKEWLML